MENTRTLLKVFCYIIQLELCKQNAPNSLQEIYNFAGSNYYFLSMKTNSWKQITDEIWRQQMDSRRNWVRGGERKGAWWVKEILIKI